MFCAKNNEFFHTIILLLNPVLVLYFVFQQKCPMGRKPCNRSVSTMPVLQNLLIYLYISIFLLAVLDKCGLGYMVIINLLDIFHDIRKFFQFRGVDKEVGSLAGISLVLHNRNPLSLTNMFSYIRK